MRLRIGHFQIKIYKVVEMLQIEYFKLEVSKSFKFLSD